MRPQFVGRLIGRLDPKTVISAALIVAICFLGLKLAAGPLYAAYDADGCTRAYSRAHSRADSSRIDLHPYKKSVADRRGQCVQVRGQHSASTVIIPALLPPL
jgi:hypothetical protein